MDPMDDNVYGATDTSNMNNTDVTSSASSSYTPTKGETFLGQKSEELLDSVRAGLHQATETVKSHLPYSHTQKSQPTQTQRPVTTQGAGIDTNYNSSDFPTSDPSNPDTTYADNLQDTMTGTRQSEYSGSDTTVDSGSDSTLYSGSDSTIDSGSDSTLDSGGDTRGVDARNRQGMDEFPTKYDRQGDLESFKKIEHSAYERGQGIDVVRDNRHYQKDP